MINRNYIKCDTCDTPIILRVQIGNNEHPVYSFYCPICQEKIEIGLNISTETVSFEYIYKENCSPIEENEDGTIINLSAELPVDERYKNKDKYFPFLFTKKELFGTKKVDFPVIKRVHKNWKNLRRACNLTVSKKHKIANRFIENYEYIYDPDKDNDIFSQLHDFISFFLLPEKYKYIENVLEQSKLDQKKYKQEYLKLFEYFIENIFEKNFQKIINIISKYMENFEALYPILLYIRSEKYIPSEISTSSFSFESLKMFYGNAFELLSNLFELLAIINNIHNGRDFDKFKSMDLKKYKTIDKAKRANPFYDNEVLYHFTEEFNSSIRNASHHDNMKLVSENIILYSSGKPLKEKQMSTREYIISCNKIFINILSIADIMLYFNEFSRIAINKWGFMK